MPTAFDQTLAAIDALHAEDPRATTLADGTSMPQELAYAQRACKDWAGWVQIIRRDPFPGVELIMTWRYATSLEFMLECYVELLCEVSEVPRWLVRKYKRACRRRLHLARFADDYYLDADERAYHEFGHIISQIDERSCNAGSLC